MARSAGRFVAVAAFLITAWMNGAAVAAAPKPSPAITSATVSADHTTLFVDGVELGPNPTVTVGEVSLTGVAVDASWQRLSALLPELAPGTYLLQVTVGKNTAQFAVAVGTIGPAGPEGPAGAAGPAGEPGAQGADGAVGATGPAGEAGPAGPQGPTGVTGPAGAPGPAGPLGLTGATGPAGVAGPAGPAGPAGAMGPAGDPGPAGAAGPAGADGSAGPQGPVGAPGPVGPAGATGPAGPAGPMPSYFAGWIRGTTTNPALLIKFGSGFTVKRNGVAGGYKIALSSGMFHATTVTPTGLTPTGLNVVARIVQASIDGLTGLFTIDVEIRNPATGALVDSEFNFIALFRS